MNDDSGSGESTQHCIVRRCFLLFVALFLCFLICAHSRFYLPRLSLSFIVCHLQFSITIQPKNKERKMRSASVNRKRSLASRRATDISFSELSVVSDTPSTSRTRRTSLSVPRSVADSTLSHPRRNLKTTPLIPRLIRVDESSDDGSHSAAPFAAADHPPSPGITRSMSNPQSRCSSKSSSNRSQSAQPSDSHSRRRHESSSMNRSSRGTRNSRARESLIRRQRLLNIMDEIDEEEERQRERHGRGDESASDGESSDESSFQRGVSKESSGSLSNVVPNRARPTRKECSNGRSRAARDRRAKRRRLGFSVDSSDSRRSEDESPDSMGGFVVSDGDLSEDELERVQRQRNHRRNVLVDSDSSSENQTDSRERDEDEQDSLMRVHNENEENSAADEMSQEMDEDIILEESSSSSERVFVPKRKRRRLMVGSLSEDSSIFIDLSKDDDSDSDDSQNECDGRNQSSVGPKQSRLEYFDRMLAEQGSLDEDILDELYEAEQENLNEEDLVDERDADGMDAPPKSDDELDHINDDLDIDDEIREAPRSSRNSSQSSSSNSAAHSRIENDEDEPLKKYLSSTIRFLMKDRHSEIDRRVQGYDDKFCEVDFKQRNSQWQLILNQKDSDPSNLYDLSRRFGMDYTMIDLFMRYDLDACDHLLDRLRQGLPLIKQRRTLLVMFAHWEKQVQRRTEAQIKRSQILLQYGFGRTLVAQPCSFRNNHRKIHQNGMNNDDSDDEVYDLMDETDWDERNEDDEYSKYRMVDVSKCALVPRIDKEEKFKNQECNNLGYYDQLFIQVKKRTQLDFDSIIKVNDSLMKPVKVRSIDEYLPSLSLYCGHVLTAWFIAVFDEDITRCARLLNDIGVPINIPGDLRSDEDDQLSGVSALTLAAHCGKLASVKFLLRQNNVDIESPAEWAGETALFRACVRGHREVAKQLLLAGADPDTRTSQPEAFMDATTPVAFECISRNCLDCIPLLIEYGADVLQQIEHRSTLVGRAYSVIGYAETEDCAVEMIRECVVKRLTMIHELLEKRFDGSETQLSSVIVDFLDPLTKSD